MDPIYKKWDGGSMRGRLIEFRKKLVELRNHEQGKKTKIGETRDLWGIPGVPHFTKPEPVTDAEVFHRQVFIGKANYIIGLLNIENRPLAPRQIAEIQAECNELIGGSIIPQSKKVIQEATAAYHKCFTPKPQDKKSDGSLKNVWVTRIAGKNPQFIAQTPEPFGVIALEFTRNCKINGDKLCALKDFKTPESRELLAELLQANLSSAAGKESLPGFIKYILADNAIYEKLCQANLTLQNQLMTESLFYAGTSDTTFNLSWNTQKKAWSAKIELSFNMSTTGAPGQAANGHYVAEILYQSTGKETITLNAKFSTPCGRLHGLTESELQEIIQLSLQSYQRSAAPVAVSTSPVSLWAKPASPSATASSLSSSLS